MFIAMKSRNRLNSLNLQEHVFFLHVVKYCMLRCTIQTLNKDDTSVQVVFTQGR